MTGWRQDEALGKPIEEIFDIINEDDREPVKSPVHTVFERDKIVELANHTLLLSKNGDEIPIEDTAAPIKNASGKTVGCVLVFRDFSERREKQRRIEYLSFHDQLTGLYNRRYFEEELVRLDQEKTYPVSLIYADVNGLKIINDAFGHENGDRVIRWVAEVFTAVCAKDTVARIGGDEFIILLLDTGREAVEKIVERLRFQTADMAFNNVDLSISYGWDTKENAVQSTFSIFKNAEDLMYRKKLLSNSSNRHGVIKSILNTLHVKCPREGAHSWRVRDICKDIGTACGLASDELRELVAAGELHDIGKIAIDEVVLEKEGTLSPLEWEQIKRHPETGYRLLSATNEFVGLAETVLSHHERWDGKGYPRGLAGEAISRHARVIAIADSYDAMTSDRPYRKALSLETAAEEIRRGAGTQFDPELARIFIEKVLGLAWE
jgi:diguanylate cyclase (GGDEF)-like protein/PAS domain S-box-containing protein